VSENEELTPVSEVGRDDGRLLHSTQIANKYEAAIVAAMEARRLNDITRVTGESLSARVTQMAIENVNAGRVSFQYGDPVKPTPPAEPEE
jgi:hypothetical protein